MPKIKTPPPRARLLKRVRKFLKMTQREMARRMSCDPATLSQWETGALPIPDQRLDTLSVLIMAVVVERVSQMDETEKKEASSVATAISRERDL